MALIYSRLKVVVEPAAATGLAALLKGEHRHAGLSNLPIIGGVSSKPRIGVILCGGNVDLTTLTRRFAHLAC